MNVKIDTKEKFTVITPVGGEISANMTGKLEETLLSYLQKDPPHIILNMKNVEAIDKEAGEKIAGLQQQFYTNNHSFIICELKKGPENLLNQWKLLENMNITPTESEAWDMAQMEEIERELLGDNEDPA